MFRQLTYRKRVLGATLPFLRAISQVELINPRSLSPTSPPAADPEPEAVVVVTVVVVQVTPGC